MRTALRTILALGLVTGLAVVFMSAVGAQAPQVQPQAAAAPINQSDDPLLKSFRWRNIGPATMAGRIDRFAVVESNPSIYYIGFATGGIWKTVNNGTTFTPIFDTYPVSSIGDIGIAPSNPNILYVGTGEPNNRQSSSFGDGVYKSTDAGKTFTHVGLKETQSIARVLVHPTNPDIVYVAAIGHLFGPNKERGLYKTIDGGKTWTNTNFIDEDTGFTDVAMDPKNPEVLFAASYQRRRTPHGFNGGGPGSGLWKTANGGKTWTRLKGNGLPESPIIGRIGLDICLTKPNVIIAQFEVGASGGTGAGVTDDGKEQVAGQRGGGAGAAGAGAAAGAAAAGQAGARGGAAAAGQAGARGGQAGGAPAAPPDPKQSGVWRSDDGGKTWRVVSNTNNRPMYYSKLRVDPNNDQVIYLGGASAYKSIDGGKTFRTLQGFAHGDHHAIWVDPRNSNHVMYGNDGGLDVSYDGGETWDFIATMAVGQFYAISADMRKPYYVCGGLQDNGSWCGPSAKRSSVGILNSDWFRVGGGDGFYTQQDPTDWAVMYSESQDGAVSRLDLRAGTSVSIRPRGARGGAQAQNAAAQALAAQNPQFAARRRLERGAGAAGRHGVPVLLEHADRALAPQPEHRVHRRQPAVQVGEPRRDVHDDAGPHARAEPVHAADHGRGRRRADGVEARRRGDDQRHHDRGRVAGDAGRHLGGHQRRQRPGDARRRRHVEERRRQHQGCAGRDARRARRAVPLRRGHLLRGARRAPHRRPQAVRLRHEGLRPDVHIDCGEPADGQRERDSRGPEEPQPALPRHRVRPVRLGERWQGVEAGS